MPGQGSIFQRADGKWVAQWSQGGRADRRYKRRIRKTRKEAALALVELERDARAWSQPSKRSLGDYLRRWLSETVTGSVAPNTVRGYRAAIEHFAPIHHIALVDLRAEHIEEACNRMRSTRYNGPRSPLVDKGPAAPKTVRNAQLMLRTALESAFQRGHVERNEAKLVKLRKVPRQHRTAMTPAMANAILDAIAGDRYEAAYILGFAALRASEILGLTVGNVDFDGGSMTITHQLRGSGARAQLAPAKTEASEESIDLPEFVLEALRAHFEQFDPVALVFTTERGLAVHGGWFNKHFQALLAKAGLPKMHVHQLRHGAGALLADQGAHPSMAQGFLRHASPVTTLAIYTATTPEQRRATAMLLDKAVGKRPVSHAVSHPDPNIVPPSGADEGEVGSGGRTRTYDQAVNSRLVSLSERAPGESRGESRR